MKALKQYAKFLKKKKACEKILDDLWDAALRELRKAKDGKDVVDGVDFHLTVKTTRRYAPDIQDILKDLQAQIDQQKKLAEESEKVQITATTSFDAEIPKASLKKVLAEVPDYARHFGL